MHQWKHGGGKNFGNNMLSLLATASSKHPAFGMCFQWEKLQQYRTATPKMANCRPTEPTENRNLHHPPYSLTQSLTHCLLLAGCPRDGSTGQRRGAEREKSKGKEDAKESDLKERNLRLDGHDKQAGAVLPCVLHLYPPHKEASSTCERQLREYTKRKSREVKRAPATQVIKEKQTARSLLPKDKPALSLRLHLQLEPKKALYPIRMVIPTSQKSPMWLSITPGRRYSGLPKA
mmetsp:Transcript_19666/g.42593  ORF Transcript_19666/g.42593 Transcript_19666/m.42593 type:complete len:233 (+) Transcript_19666:252-950(+)